MSYRKASVFLQEYAPIGRSVRSTTASVIQIPTTPTPIILKKNHETSKVGTTSTVSTVQVADRPCFTRAS